MCSKHLELKECILLAIWSTNKVGILKKMYKISAERCEISLTLSRVLANLCVVL